MTTSVFLFQFLKKYDDKFVFDGTNVALKDYGSSNTSLAEAQKYVKQHNKLDEGDKVTGVKVTGAKVTDDKVTGDKVTGDEVMGAKVKDNEDEEGQKHKQKRSDFVGNLETKDFSMPITHIKTCIFAPKFAPKFVFRIKQSPS